MAIVSNGSIPTDWIGPFRLETEVGRGASGLVFRAIDSRDGRVVALKLLRELPSSSELQRFRREHQILSEIDHPNVVRFLEAGLHEARPYIITEFVEGGSLAHKLARSGAFDEPLALRLVAEIVRALVTPHQHGVIHRDLKPDNILLRCRHDLRQVGLGDVKVADFGLARFVAQSQAESLVTQTGVALGTPVYMAPEQGSGKADIRPAADVYSIGVLLFELIAGRPPFTEHDPINLILRHRHEAPPRLTDCAPDASDECANLVAKALRKRPSSRHQDAAEFLQDLLRVANGQPMRVEQHPRAFVDPGHRSLEYEFQWDLRSSPQVIWPLVSNTERLNEAINLPAVEFETHRDTDGVLRRYGAVRLIGIQLHWEEHPFEWIEGRRLAVERSFSQGPFRSLVSEVELSPGSDGGTELVHRFTIQPRSVVGRAVAAVEVGVKARTALDRVYRRIDEWTSKSRDGCVDPFRPAPKMRADQQRSLNEILAGFRQEHSNGDKLIESIEQFVIRSSAQELSRIRTLAFADRFLHAHEDVLDSFIKLASRGLFDLTWDVICPSCRMASQLHATLRDVQAHAHCPACDLGYDVDFAESVELVFRVNSRIRAANTGTYCVGGPSHAPHVCAQLRLHPAERLDLPLNLTAGSYCLRAGELKLPFEVRDDGLVSDWEVELYQNTPDHAPTLQPHEQILRFTNHGSREEKLKIERDVPREQILSALRAVACPAFRAEFPGECLAASQLSSVKGLAVVAIRWDAPATAQRKTDRLRADMRRMVEQATSLGSLATDRQARVLLLAFPDVHAAVSAVGTLLDELRPEVTDPNGQARGNADRLPAQFAVVLDYGPSCLASDGETFECFGETPSKVLALVHRLEPRCLLVGSALSGNETAHREILRRWGTPSRWGQQPEPDGLLYRS